MDLSDVMDGAALEGGPGGSASKGRCLRKAYGSVFLMIFCYPFSGN